MGGFHLQCRKRLSLDSALTKSNPLTKVKININADLQYEQNGLASYLLALRCIQTGGQRILNESLLANPACPLEEFTILTGMNRFTRVDTDVQGVMKISYQATVENSFLLTDTASLSSANPAHPSPEAIPYLFPSRYCQSDGLRQEASDLFGNSVDPYSMAASISEWVFGNVSYQAGTSDETSSAVDTLQSKTGVCRDFAHLTIALCRAMNIPARYVSVYSAELSPQDFHAVVEVYVGGMWYLLDSTRLAPLDGMVRIATGRDAADVSVATISGPSTLTASVVSCVAADGGRPAVTHESLRSRGQAFALL